MVLVSDWRYGIFVGGPSRRTRTSHQRREYTHLLDARRWTTCVIPRAGCGRLADTIGAEGQEPAASSLMNPKTRGKTWRNCRERGYVRRTKWASIGRWGLAKSTGAHPRAAMPSRDVFVRDVALSALDVEGVGLRDRRIGHRWVESGESKEDLVGLASRRVVAEVVPRPVHPEPLGAPLLCDV